MSAQPYALVDVFASEVLAGNALAVVPWADDLDLAQRSALAREFNLSETTFIVDATSPTADYALQSLTPTGAEVGGAGHNALGAWLWLAHSGKLASGRTNYITQIGDDLLDVWVRRDELGSVTVTMRQTAPQFGEIARDRTRLAIALGLTPAELADADPQVVSTGAGHLLIPVRTEDAVDRAMPLPALLSSVLAQCGGEGAYLYTTETSGTDAYARFFNPTMGIAEDPATGTAAGPLAAWLVEDGRVADGSTVTVRQGVATGRPSTIAVTVCGRDVRIHATGVLCAEGVLYL